MEEKFGTGAIVSELDPRTIKHLDLAGVPLIFGGVIYTPADHDNQHHVGICTAISRTELRQKQTGRKYSPDFQYLLQKKYCDGGFNYEGSSILSANKIAYNYGFLPLELFTYITEADRSLPYDQYILKLQAIPDAEIERLAGKPSPLTGKIEGGLCVDKIVGYAQVEVNDAQAVAKAVIDSPNQAGILCRYGCQSNWWTPPIDPLRYAPETSGHAIILSSFDYNISFMQMLANTWGPYWNIGGNAHINWSNYPMSEAWVDLLVAPVVPKYVFTKLLKYGMRGFDVKQLQLKLKGLVADSVFGNATLRAVKAFQTVHGLVADGIVGPKTNAELNK